MNVMEVFKKLKYTHAISSWHMNTATVQRSRTRGIRDENVSEFMQNKNIAMLTALLLNIFQAKLDAMFHLQISDTAAEREHIADESAEYQKYFLHKIRDLGSDTIAFAVSALFSRCEFLSMSIVFDRFRRRQPHRSMLSTQCNTRTRLNAYFSHLLKSFGQQKTIFEIKNIFLFSLLNAHTPLSNLKNRLNTTEHDLCQTQLAS